jgi:outer membrane biosynthesis protein TonB
MNDSQLHVVSVVGTMILQGALVAMLMVDPSCSGGSEAEARPSFADAEVIEAALAFKKVEPQSKQPQKIKKNRKKPDVQKVSRDENAKVKPKEEKEKDKPPKPPSLEDITAMNEDLAENDSESNTGADVDPVEGALDGSRYGWAAKSKGDPYVALLTGKIRAAWDHPKFDKKGGLVVGCVRLNESGTIAKSEIRLTSENPTLNSSVKKALKNAESVGEPVPDHLIVRLVKKGVCFRFDPKEEDL